MQSFLIIHLLNEVWKPSENVFQGSVLPEIDFLGFYGFHEAFGKGIIIRIAPPGHANLEIMAFELIDVVMGCVLHTPVGMMNHTGRRVPVLDRHPKR